MPSKKALAHMRQRAQKAATQVLPPRAESPLLTRAEAARYLRVSETSFVRLVHEGAIVEVPVSHVTRLYKKEDLDAFIESRRTARKAQEAA